MKYGYFLAIMLFIQTSGAHNIQQSSVQHQKKAKLVLALVAAGSVVAKPSLLLLPFKALLLPFKLIAALGTIAFFALPVMIAAGVWLGYPHWKKHKKEILAYWKKHKHLMSAHVAALTAQGKKILGQMQQGNTTPSKRPQLPPDLDLMPKYRAS